MQSTIRKIQAKYDQATKPIEQPEVVITVRQPRSERPGSTAASLPVEILLEVFSHLVNHRLDICVENLQRHHPLALTSLDLSQPFWSAKAFDKRHLLNAALTCKLWSVAARALLPTTVR